MRYDPEDLLARSGLDAPGAAAFLLENYTDFIDEGAIDDAAAAAAYLSDAGEGRFSPSWYGHGFTLSRRPSTSPSSSLCHPRFLLLLLSPPAPLSRMPSSCS